MAKPKSMGNTLPGNHDNDQEDGTTLQEPLSGSKDVKNKNHSRNNHGEGS